MNDEEWIAKKRKEWEVGSALRYWWKPQKPARKVDARAELLNQDFQNRNHRCQPLGHDVLFFWTARSVTMAYDQQVMCRKGRINCNLSIRNIAILLAENLNFCNFSTKQISKFYISTVHCTFLLQMFAGQKSNFCAASPTFIFLFEFWVMIKDFHTQPKISLSLKFPVSFFKQ